MEEDIFDKVFNFNLWFVKYGEFRVWMWGEIFD